MGFLAKRLLASLRLLLDDDRALVAKHLVWFWLVVSTCFWKILHSQNWTSSPNRGENKTYLKPPPIVISFLFWQNKFWRTPACDVKVFMTKHERTIQLSTCFQKVVKTRGGLAQMALQMNFGKGNWGFLNRFHAHLVGGFNPSEKYCIVKMGIFPR